MKDIIESLKIRFNNPFLISFLISWPFWNWKIVVSFFKYNSETIKNTGFATFVDLIDHYSNIDICFWAPVGSAILYVLLGPLIKAKISIYTAKITTKEDSDILEISRTATVPATKYLDAMKNSNDYIKELADIIKKDKAYIEENSELISKNTVLATELQKLKHEHETLQDSMQSIHETSINNRQLADTLTKNNVDLETEIFNSSEIIESLKIELKQQNNELQKVNSKLNESNFIIHKSSNDIMNGFWMAEIRTTYDRQSVYFTFSVLNNEIISPKPGKNSGVAFTSLKNYFYNSSKDMVLIVFEINLFIAEFEVLSEKYREINKKIQKCLNSKNLVGEILDGGDRIELLADENINVILIRKG